MTELVVYGANGATGTRIVELAVAAGLRPIVAGRRRDALQPIAAKHGLTVRVGALEANELDVVCRGAHVVVSCVAPYGIHGAPVLEAALRAGAHYLDCTGEPRWVCRMLHDYDAAARDAGSTIVPAAGLGTCTHIAALVAIDQRTDIDRIDIGYRITGMRPSRGTMSSTIEIMAGGSPIVRDGEALFVRSGRHLTRFHNGVGATFPLTDPVTLSMLWPSARLESFLQTPSAPLLGTALGTVGVLARSQLPRRMLAHRSGKRDHLGDERVSGHFRITVKARAAGSSHVTVADVDDAYEVTGRAAFEIASQLLSTHHQPGCQATGQIITDPAAAATRIGVRLSSPEPTPTFTDVATAAPTRPTTKEQ